MDDQIRLVAHLYHVRGMNQYRLAQKLKITQSTVSRLLFMARERGIVRTIVADYDSRNREMEVGLRSRFGLDPSIVIKTTERFSPELSRDVLGMFAAKEIESLARSNDIIAIGSGRTVRELVRNFPASRNKHVVIAQSIGRAGATVCDYDAQEIGRVLSQKLGGNFITMNTPAYVGTKEIRDTLRTSDQIRLVNVHLNQAGLAIVEIGAPCHSVFIERGLFKPEDIAEVKSAGAVGEIAGRFYDDDGRECDTQWRDRVMSIELDRLARIPKAIGVVAGFNCPAAIRAAINGGFIKGLVIDESGACALLETNRRTGPVQSVRQTGRNEKA
jgi:DNA-binding transcriptional regulator LsrR (DeoR family)